MKKKFKGPIGWKGPLPPLENKPCVTCGKFPSRYYGYDPYDPAIGHLDTAEIYPYRWCDECARSIALI